MEHGKILVLDDDPVVSMSCKRTLGAEGFDTSTIDRGHDALRLLDREHFDLLISDVRLPDMDGMAVLREAKASHPEVDVIIITGYPTLEDAKDSMRLGAVEYIEKPFTPDRMVDVARRVIDKKGWVLKKAFLRQFSDYIAPMEDSNIVHHKNGVWTRPVEGGLMEIGCDVRYWLLGGDLVYVDLITGRETVKAGEPFAKLLLSTGRIIDLASPVTADIRDFNTKANEVIVALSGQHLSDSWLLKLAKIRLA